MVSVASHPGRGSAKGLLTGSDEAKPGGQGPRRRCPTVGQPRERQTPALGKAEDSSWEGSAGSGCRVQSPGGQQQHTPLRMPGGVTGELRAGACPGPSGEDCETTMAAGNSRS